MISGNPSTLGDPWPFLLLTPCSAGSDLQAVPCLFLLGEPVFFTQFKGVIYLGKTLQVSTICSLFLANLAVVWIPLFEDHSDLKIWFRPQWPLLPCLDLPCVWGHHPPQHPAGQCLPSAPAATGAGLGWVKFPTPGIALSWLTPISGPSATTRHLCTALCWEAASSRSCRISRAGQIPSSYFPRPTTHNVVSVRHKYTDMCQLCFCQMVWHIWSDGCQNICSIPRKICLVKTDR